MSQEIKLSSEELKLIALFQKITRATARDVVEDEKLNRLIFVVNEGKMGEVIIALPDCFTTLGGNQYINSLAVGNWADFLVKEMIPIIEEKFPVKKGRENRGVFGKSSGGYGAIVHGMLYSEHWGVLACHSGDLGFESLFMGDFPKSVTHLEKHGGIQNFLDHVQYYIQSLFAFL